MLDGGRCACWARLMRCERTRFASGRRWTCGCRQRWDRAYEPGSFAVPPFREARAPDGTGLKEVTHYGVWSYRFAEDPAWSPSDGRTIVYTLFVSGGKVSVFRVAANGLTPPVRIAWNASDPDWQPRPT
jgi:hypothetical protein